MRTWVWTPLRCENNTKWGSRSLQQQQRMYWWLRSSSYPVKAAFFRLHIDLGLVKLARWWDDYGLHMLCLFYSKCFAIRGYSRAIDSRSWPQGSIVIDPRLDALHRRTKLEASRSWRRFGAGVWVVGGLISVHIRPIWEHGVGNCSNWNCMRSRKFGFCWLFFAMLRFERTKEGFGEVWHSKFQRTVSRCQVVRTHSATK